MDIEVGWSMIDLADSYLAEFYFAERLNYT